MQAFHNLVFLRFGKLNLAITISLAENAWRGDEAECAGRLAQEEVLDGFECAVQELVNGVDDIVNE